MSDDEVDKVLEASYRETQSSSVTDFWRWYMEWAIQSDTYVIHDSRSIARGAMTREQRHDLAMFVLKKKLLS